MRLLLTVGAGLALTIPPVWAHSACPGGSVTGTVRDSTRASIAGASVTLEDGQAQTSGADGRFVFACVTKGAHTVSVAADGFATEQVTITAPHGAAVDLALRPAAVQ